MRTLAEINNRLAIIKQGRMGNFTEITMREWRQAEAKKEGVSETAIANRLARGHYPELIVRHVNKRVVFVTVPNER